jgi:hypothetical protein
MKPLHILLVLVIPACSVFEDNELYRFPAGIDSIAVEKITFLTIDFSIHIYCGSMCWNGYYFEKTKINNDIYLNLFVTSDGNPCPAVCVNRSFPYKYRVLFPGTYTFHFMKNDSTSIDTTITLY